MQRLT
jgi:phosphoribosylformimino-5-aminoimidazole carboxamide ribotide isomerase